METLTETPEKWYTQKELENENCRVFIRCATLAYSVSSDDYELWTGEQKQQWETEHTPLDIDEYANSEPEE